MTNSTEIYHYGVLGMKWGVRRTPEQLGRRTIPKGTVMYRSTVNASESLSGHKYVTYLPPDRDLYRGGYANQIRTNAGKSADAPLYENQYVLKSDLKVPSRAEVKAIISDLREKDRANELAIENGKAFAKQFFGMTSWALYETMDSYVSEGKVKKYPTTRSELESAAKYIQNDVAKNYLKRVENMSADDFFIDTTRSFGVSEKNRNQIISELKKRGYNAMVDEAGVGSNKNGREGVDPLIIFDGDSSLEKRSTVKVDRKTSAKATYRHEQWWRTANRNRGKGDW